jgi:hypothetical protein
MHTFELRPVLDGFRLCGGPLKVPMMFHTHEPSLAVHLVGCLSLLYGSELLIFNAAGAVIETKRYVPTLSTLSELPGQK